MGTADSSLFSQPKPSPDQQKISPESLKHLFGRGTTIIPVAGGIHASFLAQTGSGQKFFAKVFETSEDSSLVSAHYKAIEMLKILAPRFLFQATLDRNLTCHVFEYMEGIDLRSAWPRLGKREMARLLHQSARLLAQLHLSSPSEVLEILPQIHPLIEIRKLASRTLPNNLLSKLYDALNYDLANTPPAPHVVFCHGDFNLKNLLLTPHGKLALIDWEWACLSVPALDFKNLRQMIDSGYRNLGTIIKHYQKLTTVSIPEKDLLLSDLYHSLIMVNFAQRHDLDSWHKSHLERCKLTLHRINQLNAHTTS